MFGNIKKILIKWGSGTRDTTNEQRTPHLVMALLRLLEDILLWKNMWLSLSSILLINVLFFICVLKEINLLQFCIAVITILISVDALEIWLKYKHRISIIQRISTYQSVKLYQTAVLSKIWLKKRFSEYVILRETNPTKAFLLINLILGAIYIIGRSISGYTIMFILLNSILVSYLLIPHITRTMKKIQQHADSDNEIDNLIPTVSEQELKDLTFELENAASEKQSLDYWKLEELQAGESSDSSGTSSLFTNISKDKLKTLEKDVTNSSDSSDEDYIPIGQHEQPQSTLEIVQTDTWGNSAYSALCNITDAVSNMVYSQPTRKHERVSSIEPSDDFELIDKNDIG